VRELLTVNRSVGVDMNVILKSDVLNNSFLQIKKKKVERDRVEVVN